MSLPIAKTAVAMAIATMAVSAQAATIYYCKCGTGAGAGCTPGSNSNAGTDPAAPKLDIPSTATLNASGAGGQHLFCRTGAWDDAVNGIFFTVANTATAANPIVVGAYTPSWATASDNVPRINSTSTSGSNNCFRIFGVASNIVFRDFNCVGLGATAGAPGLYMYNSPQNITFDNVEVSGYTIGLSVDATATMSASNVTIRNSYIHSNKTQGILGCGPNVLIENNRFVDNGAISGLPDHNHNIYCSVAIGNYKLSGVIRGNYLTKSAYVSNICQGNNIEVHNQAEDLVIENNFLDESTGAGGGCYGIELNPGNGNGSVEGFNRIVVRGNTIINHGSFCLSFSSIRNSQIVNNKCIWNQGQTFTKFGISNNAVSTAGEDLPDLNNTYANNSFYFSGNQANDRGIYLKLNPVAGSNTGHVVTGNVVYWASGTSANSYCYEIAGGLTSSGFTRWDRNQCYRVGGDNKYMLVGATPFNTLASAQPTWDPNGSVADPGLVATPASGNNWSLAFTSAITADTTYCPILGFHSITYTGSCKAGAEAHGFSAVGPATPTRITVQ